MLTLGSTPPPFKKRLHLELLFLLTLPIVMIATVYSNSTAISSAFEQHHRDNVYSNDREVEAFSSPKEHRQWHNKSENPKEEKRQQQQY